MESKQTKRKPNWNADETLALASLVEENKHILRGKLGPTLTSEMKHRTWQSIAERLAAMGVGPARTAVEVEKKWHNVFSKSKSEISDHRRVVTGTGGGPPPKPLSAVATTVCGVVGEDNACLSGIDGGIDSSLLQILNIGEGSQPVGINVFEGPPGMDPLILNSSPLVAAPVQEPSLPLTSMTTSLQASENRSSQPDLKRRIEELICRKLELEVQYMELKIKKLKQEE
ncbi:uncharacterized protein LOC125653405 [Ostrea edulis]|uniref:uncharacterized protein LOC125653405 n=1 Tax=Ostrea edulis TaxID=37623 RepID=UPI0020964BA1|nr:uncharacterized protein LOC125653405 [Ostrea edulis]